MNGSRTAGSGLSVLLLLESTSNLMLLESKRLSVSQSPLLKKCKTERQRKKDTADGAVALGWIAASLAGEQPAGQQQHHHL